MSTPRQPADSEEGGTPDRSAAARAWRFDREQARSLRALAYRMLGSRAEAEDIVQEAWLRWAEVDEGQIRHAGAFLSRLVTNLCLDRLRSAALRRELYVGTWLPEPLVDSLQDWQPDPQSQAEYAQELSLAFLLALERLTPLERAAFVLHDVFGMEIERVAEHLSRSVAASRQLSLRARAHVKAGHARVTLAESERQRLLQAFLGALASGDVQALARVLSEDAVLLADGGGKVQAVPYPLQGGARIAKALVGFAQLVDLGQMRLQLAPVNGLPGYVLFDAQGRPIQSVALAPQAGGRVREVYVQLNPDKLRHLVLPDALRAISARDVTSALVASS
ncbi:RNA polymerase sigma factor SigJ [Paucibacter sp. O1-1]|nr:RNA polymerase sigma factor SigJ [Paucibacter sp. O1-1]MDA3829602.1 RNA polymerase sigma factor SigJ [Paucibacter sp. O1-1]